MSFPGGSVCLRLFQAVQLAFVSYRQCVGGRCLCLVKAIGLVWVSFASESDSQQSVLLRMEGPSESAQFPGVILSCFLPVLLPCFVV